MGKKKRSFFDALVPRGVSDLKIILRRQNMSFFYFAAFLKKVNKNFNEYGNKTEPTPSPLPTTNEVLIYYKIYNRNN